MILLGARLELILLLAVQGILAFAAVVQPNLPLSLNQSSFLDALAKNLTTASAPTANGCFNALSPHFPLPAHYEDCYEACDKLLELLRVPPTERLKFGKQHGSNILLPQSVSFGTCQIRVDVTDPRDEDIFDLWTLHGAGLDLAYRCTEGPNFNYGGIRAVGSKGVVDMIMSGRMPPPVFPTASSSLPLATAGATAGNATDILNNTTITGSVDFSKPESATNDGCFDKSTDKGSSLVPAEKIDCYQAADNLIDVLYRQPRDIPLKFGHKGSGIDIELPSNSYFQTCAIAIDVSGAGNRDTFELWDLYGAALDLVSRCITNDRRYGGKRTVGPKGVVEVWLRGRQPDQPTIKLGSTAATNAPIVARRQLQSNALTSPDSSLPKFLPQENIPVVNTTNVSDPYECFSLPPHGQELYPTNLRDCVNAAQDLIQNREPYRLVAFARNARAGYRLPKVVRDGTCVISVDVLDDDDTDILTPWHVYTTAVNFAQRCTQRPYILGGRMTVAPKRVVNIVMFGRLWPPMAGIVEPEVSDAAPVEERAQAGSSALTLVQPNPPAPSIIENIVPLDMPSLNTSILASTNSSRLPLPSLNGIPECNDPPLPRERAWPIDFLDCEAATYAIVGDRDRTAEYTFSRKPLTIENHYPLPTTLRYKTCVILLDMINDQEDDTVRLTYVESTAWVLAHKCSGLEKGTEEYGGRVTVGVGAKDLINIWVYGRIWPPPLEGVNSTASAVVGDE